MTNKYRDTRNQQRITVFIGLVLTVAMGASAILPLLQNSVVTAPITQPTPRPEATVPAPQDVSTISFDERVLHQTGLFSFAVPTDYTVSTQYNDEDEAQVVLRNANTLSLAEIRVLADEEATTTEALNDVFTGEWLQASWREYSSWEEDRRVVNEDGQLEIDFSLTRGTQNYIARQLAYVQDGRVYMTRVVTPDNAANTLTFILQNLQDSIEVTPAFANTPLSWSGYTDEVLGHIIRFPSEWQVTDSAPGAPASIVGDDIALRVLKTDQQTINSEEEASAYVITTRPGATLLGTTATESNGVPTYMVAYELTTPDGRVDSGLVKILASEGAIHVADLRLLNTDANLLADDASATYGTSLDVLNTFNLVNAVETASAE